MEALWGISTQRLCMIRCTICLNQAVKLCERFVKDMHGLCECRHPAIACRSQAQLSTAQVSQFMWIALAIGSSYALVA